MKLSFYDNSCRLFLVSVNNINYKQISKMFPSGLSIARYFSFIFFSLLVTSPLHAGSSGGLYDMSKLLAESHPFAKKDQGSITKTKKTIIRIEKIGSKQEPPTFQTFTEENTGEVINQFNSPRLPLSAKTSKEVSQLSVETKKSENSASAKQKISPMIVTGTRIESGIPGASVSIISKEDIENAPTTDLSTLLGQQSGVQMRDLFGGINGVQATVDVRGFGTVGTQNSLILIDGRRLNDIDLAAVDFGKIPLDSIERIEVIKGNAGSVLYGDGAVGGVINIITKPSSTKTRASAKSNFSYGSHSRRESSVSSNISVGDVSSRIFINRITSDGYRDNNAYSQRNLVGEIKRDMDFGSLFTRIALDDSSLGLPGSRQINRPAGVNLFETDPEGTVSFVTSDLLLQNGIHFTLGGTYEVTEGLTSIIDLGYRRKSQDSVNNNFTLVDTDLDTYSITPRVNLDYPVGNLFGSAVLGMDYYYAEYESDRKNGISQVRPSDSYDAFQHSFSTYGQATFPWKQNTELSSGLRIQSVNTQAGHLKFAGSFATKQVPLDDTSTQWAGNLGVNHRVSDSVDIFGRVGRSIRVPTIDERISSSARDATTFELNTQTSKDIEFGAKYIDPLVNFTTSAWYMKLKNEIAFNSQAVAFGTNVNYDPTRRYGFESEVSYKVKKDINLKGNLNFIDAKFDSGPFRGNNIPVVSPWTASAGAIWNIWEDSLNLSATWDWWDRKYLENDERNIFEKVPMTSVTDIKAYGKVNLVGEGNILWTLQANNIFDEKYFTYGVASATSANVFNAFPMPGRTFLFSVGSEF
jgi:iron complex outermembrane receptor protein